MLTGTSGDKRQELRLTVLASDRASFDDMMANGDSHGRSLNETLGSALKGTWTRENQRSLVAGVASGSMSAQDQITHSRKLVDRRVVDATHRAYATSLKYFRRMAKLWDLPPVLIPPRSNPIGGAFYTIITMLFMYLSATLRNSKSKTVGEAQKKTIIGHIARLRSMHWMINILWPEINPLLNGLGNGYSKRLIDLNGIVPKKKATAMNVQIYKQIINMRWPTEFSLEEKIKFLSLFLTLWEGLLRQGGLIQTDKRQAFSPKWYLSVRNIRLLVPPSRSMAPPTHDLVRDALVTPGSVITVDKPPIKNNCVGQMDIEPMMTKVDRIDCSDISPGYYLAQHIRLRMDALKHMDYESMMDQPVYVDAHTRWMTETEAKRVFKLVVTQALTLRDGKPPSKACMKGFTLYSNKVGKKVHLDYSKSISGTETRFMGGWAATGGDADYSRPLPSSMCDAHGETNNMNLNTLQ